MLNDQIERCNTIGLRYQTKKEKNHGSSKSTKIALEIRESGPLGDLVYLASSVQKHIISDQIRI